MSASQEELIWALEASVDGMTELLLRGMLTKSELLELIDKMLTDKGYTD